MEKALIVFGAKGAGKSTLCDILLGKERAFASPPFVYPSQPRVAKAVPVQGFRTHPYRICDTATRDEKCCVNAEEEPVWLFAFVPQKNGCVDSDSAAVYHELTTTYAVQPQSIVGVINCDPSYFSRGDTQKKFREDCFASLKEKKIEAHRWVHVPQLDPLQPWDARIFAATAMQHMWTALGELTPSATHKTNTDKKEEMKENEKKKQEPETTALIVFGAQGAGKSTICALLNQRKGSFAQGRLDGLPMLSLAPQIICNVSDVEKDHFIEAAKRQLFMFVFTPQQNGQIDEASVAIFHKMIKTYSIKGQSIVGIINRDPSCGLTLDKQKEYRDTLNASLNENKMGAHTWIHVPSMQSEDERVFASDVVWRVVGGVTPVAHKKEEPTVAVIAFGTMGSGKSTICDILCEEQGAFVTASTAFACTTYSKSLNLLPVYGLRAGMYNVNDTPGTSDLDVSEEKKEAKEEKIQEEIEKCIRPGETQLWLFVITPKNGRISNNSIAAYQQLVKTCGVQPKSIVGIVNCDPSAIMSSDKQKTYRDKLATVLHEHKIQASKWMFLPKLDTSKQWCQNDLATQAKIDLWKVIGEQKAVEHKVVSERDTLQRLEAEEKKAKDKKDKEEKDHAKALQHQKDAKDKLEKEEAKKQADAQKEVDEKAIKQALLLKQAQEQEQIRLQQIQAAENQRQWALQQAAAQMLAHNAEQARLLAAANAVIVPVKCEAPHCTNYNYTSYTRGYINTCGNPNWNCKEGRPKAKHSVWWPGE